MRKLTIFATLFTWAFGVSAVNAQDVAASASASNDSIVVLKREDQNRTVADVTDELWKQDITSAGVPEPAKGASFAEVKTLLKKNKKKIVSSSKDSIEVKSTVTNSAGVTRVRYEFKDGKYTGYVLL